MTPPYFQLTNLQVFYGNNLALEVEELSLARGGLHILTGSNGSGKSTLLSVLAFLLQPTCGEVFFEGRKVNWTKKELGGLRRRVTLLHQQSYLFSGTVFANVAFGLKVRGINGDESRGLVHQYLAAVALNGFEKRKVGHLSGGEARRVALARALACRPEVLLLDEPLAHVDKETSGIVERLIASLAASGTTIVMSSHDERIGERLEGRVYHLVEGRLERGESSTRHSALSRQPGASPH